MVIVIQYYIHLNPFVHADYEFSSLSFPYSSFDEYGKDVSVYEIRLIKILFKSIGIG
jgi:hypothetical protein